MCGLLSEKYGVKRRVAVDFFEDADRDGDSHLSFEEFVNAQLDRANAERSTEATPREGEQDHQMSPSSPERLATADAKELKEGVQFRHLLEAASGRYAEKNIQAMYGVGRCFFDGVRWTVTRPKRFSGLLELRQTMLMQPTEPETSCSGETESLLMRRKLKSFSSWLPREVIEVQVECWKILLYKINNLSCEHWEVFFRSRVIYLRLAGDLHFGHTFQLHLTIRR